MKKTKYIYLIVLTALFMLFTIHCSKEDEAVKISGVSDVSSRITQMDTAAGPGAVLIINGTQLSGIERIIFGNIAIAANDMIVSDSSLTINVPVQAPLGYNDLVFVFPGIDRAYSTIKIFARQTLRFFNPSFGGEGDTIAVYGTYLNLVQEVRIGTVLATIIESTYDYLKFIVPAGAYTDFISLITPDATEVSRREFIACENSEEYICLPNLALNNEGGFELGTIGVADADGDLGVGGWYIAGNTTRQTVEIMPASEVADPNYPGLDSLVAKVTINSTFLNSADFTNDWQIQIVYTVDSSGNNPDFPSGQRYAILGKVWSDLTGRQLKVHGGVARPGYSEMDGATTLTLNRGWNEFSVEIQHPAAFSEKNHVRVQLSYGYLINDGVTFYFDDIRLVEIGPPVKK